MKITYTDINGCVLIADNEVEFALLMQLYNCIILNEDEEISINVENKSLEYTKL